MSEHLLEKLQKYSASDAYPLHMPGHKRQAGYFGNPYEIDITEIDGFDNLHHAEGVLLELQQRAARLYGADETYCLVNGSTCGILAAVSACVRRGGRILIARNCHKAVYHAVFLRGLEADYVYPETDFLRGISGSISPKKVCEALETQAYGKKRIEAVLITSPTYDGVGSDIRRIADIVHKAGAVLIVDEAHGAHFAMHPDFPDSAVACGADLVINSLHKTMPSLTQSALLHVCGTRVNRERLKKYLGIYQTSSPSYVLMAGIDGCITQMQAQRNVLFHSFLQRLKNTREKLRGMRVLHLVDGCEAELLAWRFDLSKILISTEKCERLQGADGNVQRYHGPWLAKVLRERYHLEVEMEAEHYVTAIMTVCDAPEGFDRMEQALLEIDGELAVRMTEMDAGLSAEMAKAGDELTFGMRSAEGILTGETFLFETETVFTIQETEDYPCDSVSLYCSAGRISAEFVYLYPPGIPLVVPGERISKELLAKLKQYRSEGMKIQGMADYTGEKILVVREEKISGNFSEGI